MSILPAVVTILDLPLATTLSSAAMFEAVQTTAAGVPESVRVGVTQIMTTSLGALPAGGATGQVLGKSSGTDYATGWVSPSSFVAANATSGLTIAGSTSLALALASVAGLSVLGVPGTTTAIPLAITGASGGQVLRLNDAGTGVAFGAVNLASAAAVTGVLSVPSGGSGTTLLAAFGVVVGAGTAALQVAAPATAGNVLIDQGAAANPAFRVVGGDMTMSSAGTATIGANVVSYAKIQAGTGLAVLGFATTAASNVTTFVASAANQVLQVATTGTSLAWGLPAQVLLNTLSPNSVATIGDVTSFTTTFKSYLITFENVIPANSTAILQLQVATSGSTFVTGNYGGGVPIVTSGQTTIVLDVNGNFIGLTGARATTYVTNDAGHGASGFMRVFNPAGTVNRKHWVGEMMYFSAATGNNPVMATPFGYFISSTALTGFQVSMSTGNIATGVIKVYGLT